MEVDNRIAKALERIADALEAKAGVTGAKSPISIKLDGHTLAREVIQYTLRQAARGPSSMTGGTVHKKEEKRGDS
jgi:hypothetical protein